MKKMTCKEVRNQLLKEFQRFKSYTVDEVERYIKYNFLCTKYTVKKLSHEFAGR